jgi:hypothetical protein
MQGSSYSYPLLRWAGSQHHQQGARPWTLLTTMALLLAPPPPLLLLLLLAQRRQLVMALRSRQTPLMQVHCAATAALSAVGALPQAQDQAQSTASHSSTSMPLT